MRVNFKLKSATGVALLLTSFASQSWAARINKMFDVPQNKRPEWGTEWCAPCGVGNSFAWLAKEYGFNGLMQDGVGAPLTAEGVINILGLDYMGTDPNLGTDRTRVEQAKKDYIRDHGLAGQISVEAQVAIPTQKPDGSFGGYTGTRPSKEWLQEQFDKGQDVEFAVSYYELRIGKIYRLGGHVATYDGDLPGASAGGHQVSLADMNDPNPTNPFGDFQITFADPGRDDLAGQFGCIASDQYSLADYSGTTYFNTASTYNMIYDPDPLGTGDGAWLLDGYQGAGDFVSDGASRYRWSVLEAGWAESPIAVPEPASVGLVLMITLLAAPRRRGGGGGGPRVEEVSTRCAPCRACCGPL